MGTLLKSTSPDAEKTQEVRDYLFGMLKELAKMARDVDEIEVAVHLAAILKAARLTTRRETSPERAAQLRAETAL